MMRHALLFPWGTLFSTQVATHLAAQKVKIDQTFDMDKNSRFKIQYLIAMSALELGSAAINEE